MLFLGTTSVAYGNCVDVAWEGIKRTGLSFPTVPAIVVNNTIKYAGKYENGVITVKNQGNCVVMFHEFVHHAQTFYIVQLSNYDKEYEAKVLTAHVFDVHPDLKKRID
jgi:hypothetical protein